MERRFFLGMLALLPFGGWLKPKKSKVSDGWPHTELEAVMAASQPWHSVEPSAYFAAVGCEESRKHIRDYVRTVLFYPRQLTDAELDLAIQSTLGQIEKSALQDYFSYYVYHYDPDEKPQVLDLADLFLIRGMWHIPANPDRWWLLKGDKIVVQYLPKENGLDGSRLTCLIQWGSLVYAKKILARAMMKDDLHDEADKAVKLFKDTLQHAKL